MTAPLARHHRALAASGRCPSCAERIRPGAVFRGDACRHCGATLADVELAGHDVADTLSKRAWLGLGAVVVGVVGGYLVVGWIPIVGGAVLLLAHAWVRVAILGPLTARMDARRRLVTRWTCRFASAVVLVITWVGTEALLLTGVFAAPFKGLVGAAEVVLVAVGIAGYCQWQLAREERGASVAWWEVGLLGGGVGALATAAGVVLVAVALAATAVETVLAAAWAGP